MSDYVYSVSCLGTTYAGDRG